MNDQSKDTSQSVQSSGPSRLVAEARRIADRLENEPRDRLGSAYVAGEDINAAVDLLRGLSALQQAQAPQSNARTMIEWVRRIRTSKPFAKDEADLVELANEIERAAQPTTENYYDPVPPSDSPLRHAYTLDLAQLRDSRDQWEAQAKELEQALWFARTAGGAAPSPSASGAGGDR